MRIRNKWQCSDRIEDVAEPILGESETLPDQCMSVSEIFKRFALGQSIDIGDCREPVYGECMEDYEFDELHEMINHKDYDKERYPEDDDNVEQVEESEEEDIPRETPVESSVEESEAKEVV